jgi:hypothetical protein
MKPNSQRKRGRPRKMEGVTFTLPHTVVRRLGLLAQVEDFQVEQAIVGLIDTAFEEAQQRARKYAVLLEK